VGELSFDNKCQLALTDGSRRRQFRISEFVKNLLEMIRCLIKKLIRNCLRERGGIEQPAIKKWRAGRVR